MKNPKLFVVCLGVVWFCFGKLHSQTTDYTSTAETLTTKRTLMERYEPDMVLTPKEREQLKKKRLAAIKKGRETLDTMDISQRKRRKLIKALYLKPFSNRLNRAIAATGTEEDEEY
ncbi:hypothetical protein [Spongiimicrobium sp. 3-5]|uniref:hypothetical protein n=1 Tax=Spongiimicrobium sp. 3-5 TaxID=3332596 RepID=UPI0039813145